VATWTLILLWVTSAGEVSAIHSVPGFRNEAACCSAAFRLQDAKLPMRTSMDPLQWRCVPTALEVPHDPAR
jgi:hypothetical protein